MTDGLTLPSVLCTWTSMWLSSFWLCPQARPYVWCTLNLDSSVMIQCRQWQMSNTRWRLAHWRRCRRCTKVSLGYRPGLQEWYLTARRRWVMVLYALKGDVQCDEIAGLLTMIWQKPISTHHLQQVSAFLGCGNPLEMCKRPLIWRFSFQSAAPASLSS